MKSIITVHASNTPPNQSLTRADLDKRDRLNGFRKIGYHYVIQRNGKVEVGRSNDEPSLHDAIKEADAALSICLVGEAGNFTVEQKKSLVEQVSVLASRHKGVHCDQSIHLESRARGLKTEELFSWI